MNDWKIVLLHTRRETLLKQAFETAFPDRVVSLSVPALDSDRKRFCQKEELLRYFQRHVHDPKIWSSRVLTIYGSGEFHHYTYALVKMALERRGLRGFNWTYFHFDNHRDDWGRRGSNGQPDHLDCAGFVDALVHDHQGFPFFMGPDVYARKDSEGYLIEGTKIPIHHNQFSKQEQRSRKWLSNRDLRGKTRAQQLPSKLDLTTTPRESYFSFDLDLLGSTEIVTDYDQNETMTLRDLLKLVDRVRSYKRVFSADILGFPDDCFHPLSALTTVILARKIMGLGVESLLDYHTRIKKRQARMRVDYGDRGRTSPIETTELLEALKWVA